MAIAEKNSKVLIHYVVVLPGNNVFDSTIDGEPVELTIGHGRLFPKVEQALIGMRAGEKKQIELAASEAYGEYDKGKVKITPKTELPMQFEPEKGMLVEISNEDGSEAEEYQIMQVSENTVTFDANHPLAGKDIVFDVELIDIIS